MFSLHSRRDWVWLSAVLVVTLNFLSNSQPYAIITLMLNQVYLPLCLLGVGLKMSTSK